MAHLLVTSPQIRDVDLDTLEKVVSVIAYGDIEAEDVRHLTELNFIKVFRLAQLTVEYLLYVQDCLQATNNWMLQDRADIEKYLQAARLRVKELDAHLKMNKRELRRARKTAKTYEAMTALNKGGMQVDTGAGNGGEAKAASEAPMTAAMEAMVKRELAYMSERLGRAQTEVQQLRAEREEVLSQLHDIESTLVSNPGSKTSPRLQDQLIKVQAELRVAKREKEELTAQVDKAALEKRELQNQKSTLLKELDLHTAGPNNDRRAVSSSVSSMLMDAEKEKGRLETELATTQAELDAVRKQLMKTMKDQAMGGGGGGGGAEDLQKQLSAVESSNKDLAARTSDLERDLSEKKRTIRDLEDELELTRRQAAEAQQKLVQSRKQERATTEAKKESVGGFIKVDANEEIKDLQAEKVKLQERVKELQSELTEARLAKQLSDQSLAVCEAKLSQMKSAWNDLKAQLPTEQEAVPGSPMAKGGVVRQKVEEFEKLASREVPPPAPTLTLKGPSILTNPNAGAVGNNESFKFNAAKPAVSTSLSSPVATPLMIPAHAQASVQVADKVDASRNRPSEGEMRRIKAEVMSRVRGLTNDEIQVMLDDEFRVISENPFEYEGDDEARFHALLPYAVPGREGVRSVQRHSALDLGATDRLLGEVLCKVDDELATFGLDPESKSMDDREYAAAMLELALRRQARIETLPLPMVVNEQGEETHPVDFLRDALMTHLELVRRDAVVARGKPAVMEEGEMKEGERSRLAVTTAREPPKVILQAPPQQTLLPRQVSLLASGDLPKSSSASFSRMLPSANSGFTRPSFQIPDTDFDEDDEDIEEEELKERHEEENEQYNATFGARVPSIHPPAPLTSPSTLPGPSNTSLNSSLTASRINPLDQSLKKQAEGLSRSSLNQSLGKGASGNASLNQSLGRHASTGGVAAAAAALRPAAVQQLLDDEKHVGVSGGTLNSSIRSNVSPRRRNYNDFDDDDEDEEEEELVASPRPADVRSTPTGGEMMSFDEDDEDAVDEGDLSGGWKTGDQMLMPNIVKAAALANAQLAAEEELERAGGKSIEIREGAGVGGGGGGGGAGPTRWTAAKPDEPSLDAKTKAASRDVMEDSIRSWDGMNESLPTSSHWGPGGGAGAGAGRKGGGVLDLPPPRKWGSKPGGQDSDEDEEGHLAAHNKNHQPDPSPTHQGGGKAEVWRPEDDEYDIEEEELPEVKPPSKLPSFSTVRGGTSPSKHDEKPVLYLDSRP